MIKVLARAFRWRRLLDQVCYATIEPDLHGMATPIPAAA